MKKILQSKVVFFVKSMAWSLMLYSALMLAFNWDDVSRAVNGNEAITAVNTMVSQPHPGIQIIPMRLILLLQRMLVR